MLIAEISPLLLGPTGERGEAWQAGGIVDHFESTPAAEFTPYAPQPGLVPRSALVQDHRLAGWQRPLGQAAGDKQVRPDLWSKFHPLSVSVRPWPAGGSPRAFPVRPEVSVSLEL